MRIGRQIAFVLIFSLCAAGLCRALPEIPVSDAEVIMDPDAGLVAESFELIDSYYIHKEELDYYELVGGLLWDLNLILHEANIPYYFTPPPRVHTSEGLTWELRKAVCQSRKWILNAGKKIADYNIGEQIVCSISRRLKGSHNYFLTPEKAKECFDQHENPPPFPGREKLEYTSGKFAVYIKLDKFYFDWVPYGLIREVDSPKCKGVILDLRDNPGGKIQCVVDLLRELMGPDTFLFKANGLLCEEEFRTGPGHQASITKPLVVLLSDYSASGSEIFAYVIKHYERGLVIGSKTLGQANVGYTFELRNGCGLRIESAITLMPDGKDIEKLGVTPHVIAGYDESLDMATRALDFLQK